MTNFADLNVQPTYPKENIWEQKYRPKHITDVALSDELRTALNKYIEVGRIPSIVFYSPTPGTGKTTTARALSRDVGCPDPLFINASKDNSIETIRSKVMQYATTVSAWGEGKQKVVILDECERLSAQAQESLKGILEEVSANCSFILTTNDIGSVNTPLLSRCRRYDFIWTEADAAVVQKQVLMRAFGILNNEEVPYEVKAVAQLVKRSFPDNRSLLGDLNTYFFKHGKIDAGVLNLIQGYNFDELLNILKARDFKKASQWAMDNHESMGKGAYGKLFRYFYPLGGEPKLNGSGVPALALILNEAQKPKNVGTDSFLHLLATLTEIMTTSDIKFS